MVATACPRCRCRSVSLWRGLGRRMHPNEEGGGFYGVGGHPHPVTLQAPLLEGIDLHAGGRQQLNLRLEFDSSDWSQRVEPPMPPALSPNSPLPPSSPSLAGATVLSAPPLVRRTLVVERRVARRKPLGLGACAGGALNLNHSN